MSAILLACSNDAVRSSESGPSDTQTSSAPWTERAVLGNFEVNGAPIQTNEDGISVGALTNWVEASKLPKQDLTEWSMRLYVVIDDRTDATLAINSLTTGRADGRNDSAGGEMRRVDTVMMNGKRYAVFELKTGVSLDSVFENPPPVWINFAFKGWVEYTRDGATIHQREQYAEVYTR